jgi:VWFA-related protein
METKDMAANQLTSRILLVIVCSFLIGIQSSGNLPVVAQTKEKPKTDEQPGSQGSGGGYQIISEVNLATADVAVVGTPAAELSAEDFIVYDNDVAQKISYFSRDQLPVAIVILIDKSASIHPYLPVLQLAGITALRRLKPEDQVALVAFDNGFEKLSDLTEDRLQIAEKIGKIKVGNPATNIYDPLFESAAYLKINAPQRRHAIILISDNGHNLYGSHDAKHCRTELLETATTLYNLRIPSNFDDSDIQKLVEETGGDEIGVDGQATLKEGLESLITQFRMQYTIGFNPPKEGDKKGSPVFHKLFVKFANKECCPDCQLMVRGGYYSGGPPNPLPLKYKPKPQQPSDQKIDDVLVQRSILIAGTTFLDLNEIPFELSMNKQTEPDGQQQILMDFKIDAEQIEFSKAGGLRSCKMRVAIFSADEKGNGLDSKWLGIEKTVKEEDYEKVLENGIPFSTKVPIKANVDILRIVVYDVKTDRLSSRLFRLGNPTPKKPAKK